MPLWREAAASSESFRSVCSVARWDTPTCLSDGFIALPGGLGTLEELAEVATWTQLGLHAKPVVLLDVGDYWKPLVQQLDRMVEVGLMKEANRAIIRHAHSSDEALELLASVPAFDGKWITESER